MPRKKITPILPVRDEDGDLDDTGALALWTKDLHRKERSSRTVKTYTVGVRAYLRWAGENDRPTHLEGIALDDVQDWLDHLQAGGKSTSTRNIYRRSVILFLDAMTAKGMIPSNPARGTVTASVKHAPRKVVPVEDIDKMLDAARGSSFISRRATAMLRLFLDTGMRRGEMTGLRMDDIEFVEVVNNGKIVKVGSANITVSKTEPRPVPFGPETREAMELYLTARKKRIKNSGLKREDVTALFIGHKAQPLSGDGIRRALLSLAKKAGVEDMKPHRLRHTWRHQAEVDGMDLETIRVLGGWRNLNMLRLYGADQEKPRALAKGFMRFAA